MLIGILILVFEVLMDRCFLYSMWLFLIVSRVLLLCGGLMFSFVVWFGLNGVFCSFSWIWFGWLLVLLVFCVF